MIDEIRIKRLTKYTVDVIPLWVSFSFAALNFIYISSAPSVFFWAALALSFFTFFVHAVFFSFMLNVGASRVIYLSVILAEVAVMLVGDYESRGVIVIFFAAIIYVVVMLKFNFNALMKLGYERDPRDIEK